MADTSIEWTDKVWNPTRGCDKISPGCKHCYAETFAERFRGVKGHPYELGFDPRTAPHKLLDPLLWEEPRRIFVNSMSDLFLKDFDDAYIDEVLAVMLLGYWHTYQVLTKRADRMRAYLSDPALYARVLAAANRIRSRVAGHRRLKSVVYQVGISNPSLFPAKWIWWGVSVENADYKYRLDFLRETPAAVRFVSFEPLLGNLGKLNLSGIHQAIGGAESGRRARTMEEDWMRVIRDQCIAQGVAFFYKQRADSRGRKISLPLLDGKQWAEFPEVRS